jgi:corrinoid protein of di/trimethylamine methyltransferase
MDSIYSQIRQSVIDLDGAKAKELSNQIIEEEGHDFLKAIDSCAEGLREIGNQFESGAMFLPELIKSGQIMKEVTSILGPAMLKKGKQKDPIGRVVIGTVPGDVHDIGKDIVATMLFVQGFEVFDLGKDVPISRFVEKTKEVQADIVAASALLSSTMPYQKDIVQAFVEDGSRDRIKILVGGAPVTPEWVKEIGADGYGENAVEAVKVAKQLMGGKS